MTPLKARSAAGSGTDTGPNGAAAQPVGVFLMADTWEAMAQHSSLFYQGEIVLKLMLGTIVYRRVLLKLHK